MLTLAFYKAKNVSLKKPIRYPQKAVDNLINICKIRIFCVIYTKPSGFVKLPAISAICLLYTCNCAKGFAVPRKLSPALR